METDKNKIPDKTQTLCSKTIASSTKSDPAVSYTSIIKEIPSNEYKVEQVIRIGRSSIILQGRHLLMGTKIAIKVLTPYLQSDQTFRRRFIREATASRRFCHPNIATVYDLRMTENDYLYLIQEYIEGQTLKTEMQRTGRFTPAEAVEILKPIASALSAAHSAGVIHRDLKPSNIMINRIGTKKPIIKLLNLGVAKIQSAEMTNMTIADTKLGSPSYISPEQWENCKDVDRRADIYIAFKKNNLERMGE